MKYVIIFIGLFSFGNQLFSQTGFSPKEYGSFVIENQSLTHSQLKQQHPLNEHYFTGSNELSLETIDFGEQVTSHFLFTEDEQSFLEQNHFVVTERLSYYHFGSALGEIYHADLPVFVSTDAILHALHSSYDNILITLEKGILEPNLQAMLKKMYETFPALVKKYENYPDLLIPLKDVDLYVTTACALLQGAPMESQLHNQVKTDEVWNAVQEEHYKSMPLFSKTDRKLDFSQFTVRGHYEGDPVLEKYFKAMMWLGRIDFMLTPPPSYPVPWPESDIKRMNLGAFLLKELLDMANVQSYLQANDDIISFFIGQSDNLTVDEYSNKLQALGLSSAAELLDETIYGEYYETVGASNAGQQKILSSIFIMDPLSPEPDTLPVSFRLMGQKFIIDSYVFGNVVYDRVVYQQQKIKRMMPNPLDALFVLGNNDALELLSGELEKYPYAGALNSLRYLVDAYDEEFWGSSLYNIWLNAIRELNPVDDTTGFPYFMKTSAFRMQKINTQLASWSQLRHDNLLYAKQSYTGGASCSYPYAYVEPYPTFYGTIKQFAEKAKLIFAEIPSENGSMTRIKDYFDHLAGTMDTLQSISVKELKGDHLSENERNFLKTMLVEVPGICGTPPFSGWYPNLYYDVNKFFEHDFTIVDVHTQPTDVMGNMVGNVLHTGVGKVNMGFFVAPCPDDQKPTLFCGPVFSYYEKITGDFKRIPDSKWEEMIGNNELPQRPSFVYEYLADVHGKTNTGTSFLPYKQGPVTDVTKVLGRQNGMRLYPNPATGNVYIDCNMCNPEHTSIYITDATGKIIEKLTDKNLPKGIHQFHWSPAASLKGIYFCNTIIGEKKYIQKIVLQ